MLLRGSLQGAGPTAAAAGVAALCLKATPAADAAALWLCPKRFAGARCGLSAAAGWPGCAIAGRLGCWRLFLHSWQMPTRSRPSNTGQPAAPTATAAVIACCRINGCLHCTGMSCNQSAAAAWAAHAASAALLSAVSSCPAATTADGPCGQPCRQRCLGAHQGGTLGSRAAPAVFAALLGSAPP